MSHEIETIAYANALPWHGLGNKIDTNTSVDDMLVAAGLDWEIQRRPVFAQAESGEMIKLPLKRALIRSSDNKVMGVAGDIWKPFQNKDALNFFREYTEAGGAKMETAGSLRGGKMVWALASLQKGFTVNRTDHTKGYILLASPHEVGKAITVRTTSVRVVCANTMALSMANDGTQYSQNHLTKFDVTAAKERISLAKEEMVQAGIEAQKLNTLKLNEYDTVRFLSQFFQPVPEKENENSYITALLEDYRKMDKNMQAVLNSVNEAPGATPGTGWGVLNGVTHWADHIAGIKGDTRLYNSWFGSKARLKNDVNNSLLAMV